MILLSEEHLKQILKQFPQKYYVYGLCRQSGQIYYVGVGKHRRVFDHVADAKNSGRINKNTLKHNITRKELALGGIQYVLFSLYDSREVCLKLEREIISHYGRVDNKSGLLSNMTDGGDGGVGSATNTVVTEVTRAKLKQAAIRNKQLRSETMKTKWASLTKEERIEKSQQLSNAKKTKKFKDAVGNGMRLVWSDPLLKAEIISKRALTMMSKSANVLEEIRITRSNSQKAAWQKRTVEQKLASTQKRLATIAVNKEKKRLDTQTTDVETQIDRSV